MSARMVGKGNNHSKSAAQLAVLVAPFIGLGIIFMAAGIAGAFPSIGFIAIVLLASFAAVFAIDYLKLTARSRDRASSVKVITVSEHLDIAA